MTRITAVWALSLLLLSLAVADPQPWMKKENPDDLPLVVRFAKVCPDAEETYQELLVRVLTRSRLRGDFANGLGIYVDVQCTSTPDPEIFIFVIDVSFILLEGSEMMMFSEEYMKYGLASAESIRTQLRAKTEDAITDYLQANFDL